MLERALVEGVLGSYYIKVGVTMEVRFAQRARVKGLDLGMQGNRPARLRTLANALRLNFDLRVKAKTRDMEQAETIRGQVALQYKTRFWQTINIDLASNDRIDLIERKCTV